MTMNRITKEQAQVFAAYDGKGVVCWYELAANVSPVIGSGREDALEWLRDLSLDLLDARERLEDAEKALAIIERDIVDVGVRSLNRERFVNTLRCALTEIKNYAITSMNGPNHRPMPARLVLSACNDALARTRAAILKAEGGAK
jgi:hypothetical protein